MMKYDWGWSQSLFFCLFVLESITFEHNKLKFHIELKILI